MDETTNIFEQHRSRLNGLAYRMLGSMPDAEDAVQDTYLRWRGAEVDSIREPGAWLMKTCSRLAMDRMKSARVRHESYCGVWLPEPYQPETSLDPATQTTLDETVSIALMLALERLSPSERAAFLLHEVFAYSFEEVAVILGRSCAACRKLASRARSSIQAFKPRFKATTDDHRRLLDAFLKAAYSGDLDGLKSILADSIQMHSDGGGKADAAKTVLEGVDPVAHFLVRVLHDRPSARAGNKIIQSWFNGGPGVLIYEKGRLVTALSVEVGEGLIHRIFAQRNPDKLGVFAAL